MSGFMGQILVVDLSKGEVSNLEIDNSIAAQFLGGSGYASRLLYEHIDPGVDPLGPDNMLLFMTGPLTGTLAPCTGRHVVCGKSPLTQQWGESHVGGHFGAFLKFSGFDGILIKGRSEKPVTLHIDTGKGELLSADDLWGKMTGPTQEALKKKLGRVQICCIGPAGENLVKFASIVTDERVAARCGLGAVMGSKNLKAIAVGGKSRVLLHAPEEFRELAQASRKTLGEAMSMLSDQGTAMYVDIGMMFNDMPIKYFQEIEFDDADLINAKAMEEILTGRTACYACPIGCGRKVTVPEYDLDDIGGPEFQTIASFGSNLLISDLKKIALMNNLCNQYGMDTISCGSTIAFTTHLCDIGKADYGFTWANPDEVIDTIHAIAKREGVGDLLAEGSVSVARKHSAEDIVLHVRGMEIPNHDPRAFSGMATVYTTAARGASHMEGDMYSIDMGADVRKLGIVSGDRLENDDKGMTAARAQDFRAFFDSVVMCHFAIVPPETIIELLNLAIGTSYQLEDILKIGARAVTMKRLFNLKCGLKTDDERLPQPLLIPHAESVTDDFVPDVDAQLDEYYDYRKWDRKTGRPSDTALDELGLTDL
ncbi:MAG: aldehyde ferredoxin oxidoreductase family protein [Candidatus Thorarchaeota archaeon]|nr:aldehyde ferredoxin oxidoreductase family protein [Candidatus Thorarchaeota archaeon]